MPKNTSSESKVNKKKSVDRSPKLQVKAGAKPARPVQSETGRALCPDFVTNVGIYVATTRDTSIGQTLAESAACLCSEPISESMVDWFMKRGFDGADVTRILVSRSCIALGLIDYQPVTTLVDARAAIDQFQTGHITFTELLRRTQLTAWQLQSIALRDRVPAAALTGDLACWDAHAKELADDALGLPFDPFSVLDTPA